MPDSVKSGSLESIKSLEPNDSPVPIDSPAPNESPGLISEPPLGLTSFISAFGPRFEQLFSHRLDQYTLDTTQYPQATALNKALRYSSLGGGKRIRAMLVYMAAQACGNGPSTAKQHSLSSTKTSITDAAAAAVELIHCYSLVHDDLPAMDDDDLRRGKPSCHIQFGEATAILAGDALQTLAFEILSDDADCDPALQLALIRELSRASGASGMVGGQAIDLAVVNQSIDYQALTDMHRLKTGVLIDAATHMGGLCGNADANQTQALRHYAKAIGLAFQIQDDILDIEGDSAQTGKPQGADIAANKPTYPAILGLDAAKTQAQALCDEAVAALSDFDSKATALRELASYIVNRSR